jgi:hypothetical protein
MKCGTCPLMLFLPRPPNNTATTTNTHTHTCSHTFVSHAFTGADAAAHAANSVTAARARVDALRHSCSDALARFVSHAAGHLDELQQLQAVLVELLDAVAVQQPQLDGVRRLL